MNYYRVIREINEATLNQLKSFIGFELREIYTEDLIVDFSDSINHFNLKKKCRFRMYKKGYFFFIDFIPDNIGDKFLGEIKGINISSVNEPKIKTFTSNEERDNYYANYAFHKSKIRLEKNQVIKEILFYGNSFTGHFDYTFSFMDLKNSNIGKKYELKSIDGIVFRMSNNTQIRLVPFSDEFDLYLFEENKIDYFLNNSEPFQQKKQIRYHLK